MSRTWSREARPRPRGPRAARCTRRAAAAELGAGRGARGDQIIDKILKRRAGRNSTMVHTLVPSAAAPAPLPFPLLLTVRDARIAIFNLFLKNVFSQVPAADMPNHLDGTHQGMQAPDGSMVLKAKRRLHRGDQERPLLGCLLRLLFDVMRLHLGV